MDPIPKRRRTRALIAAGLALIAVVAGLSLQAWDLKGTADDFERGILLLQQSRAALGQPGDWNLDRIGRADTLNREATAALNAGRERMGRDAGLRAASAVPSLSDQARALSDVAEASLAAARAEADIIAVARVYVSTHSDPQQEFGLRLLNVLEATLNPLQDGDSALSTALTRLRADLHRPLVPFIRNQITPVVTQLEPIEREIATARGTAAAVPRAIGAQGPRRYLLIMANPAELRPAGGLAGHLGPISFADGEPTGLQLPSYGVYNSKLGRCFDVPAPLKYFLTFYRNCLELGDATWDPDFPTSARLVEEMYSSATGQTVDGVMSIDPYAIAQLLTVIGPITDQKYGELNAANFFDKIDVIVNVRNDHDVINNVGLALMAKLRGLPFSTWPRLIDVLVEQARQRHIQLYLHDPVLAAQAAAAHFDGAVLGNGDSDYVMVVDANVHANKADYFTDKSADLKVEIYPSGLNRHELTLRYDYQLPAQASKDDAMLNLDNVYWDYVRIYLPETSSVTSIKYFIDGKPTGASLGELDHLGGKTVVGLKFQLPRGHVGTVQVLYSNGLPPSSSYSVLFQKQAGIPNRRTSLEVSYPGGQAHRATDLSHDAAFLIQW